MDRDIVAEVQLDGRKLGEFTLRESIGEGGFAVVHRAEQPALEREAVVKVLHQRFAGRDDIAQRFLREARLASRIDHPYAAHIYAFGAEPDGTLWIAMELVRGKPMDKLLEQGPLSVEQFTPLFGRICEVVQNAHDHGIVHRDLKPANVMVLSRAGRLLPKLLDFGIARALDDVELPPATSTAPSRAVDPSATTEWVEAVEGATRRGQVMGSPMYMAPEQWVDAASVGPATDIYALGVLAFQALSGRAPFSEPTIEAIRQAHVERPPPSLGENFSPAIDAVIARALAKRPADRYASVDDLAIAMRSAAGLEDGMLPQLDARIRDAMIGGAVQPVAEAIAALDTARNVDQASALIWDVVSVALRWVGILALASRSKVGPGADADSEAVRDRLRELGRGRLDDGAWLALACDLVRPFADKRDAHPMPALVVMLDRLVAASARVDEVRVCLDRRAGRTHEERRASYADALAALAAVLATLEPLDPYTVVVPRGGRDERWRGIRRSPRTATASTSGLVDGQVVLVDREGRAVLQLSPLVQVARPAPGRDEELFFLDGKGARAARLVAVPYGFERADPSLDDWLRRELGTTLDESSIGDSEAPYRGLAAFTEDDTGDYVGREREVEVFGNRLIVEPLLAVVGPSGAGKSSFVQAGVIPHMPGGWRAIVVRPGASPLAALEAHLQAAGVEARGLADDPDALGDALRDAATREAATIVLVIDQLEELFTLCRDERERAAFAAAITNATRTDLDPIRIIATLRDDFLIRAGNLPVLGERLARGIQLLATPSPEDLERIIIEPARRAGYELEDPALATEMVDAVADQPGALALLSFTAAELWKLRDRHFHQLTRKAYVAIGGVGGALARHAEATLDGLSPEDRRLVRLAFRNLVTVEGTRQVLTVSELHQLLASPIGRAASERARAEAVVDRLIAARLLVTSEDTGGVARIEVIHEALLTAWPRLVEWRREDAEGARLRDQLRVAARQWDARGRPRGLLWRDDALTEYRIWRSRHPGVMTDLDEAFGHASLTDASRGRRIRRTLLVSAFLVLGIGVAVLFQLREQANGQREIAETETIRAEAEKTRAEDRRNAMFLVSAESKVQQDPTAALGWLKQYPLAAPNWNKAHELAIEAQYRGVAKHVLAAPDPDTIAFSADDRLVVAAGGHTIDTWNAASGEHLGTITHDANLVRDAGPSIALWPDGRSIAFTDENGGVFISALPIGTPRRVLTEKANRLTVSPDGRYLASGGDALQLFDRVNGTTRVLRGHVGPVQALAFSRDGTRLLTGGEDRSVRSWDLSTNKDQVVLTHDAPVIRLAVSPTGSEIAVASADALLVHSGGRSRVLQRGTRALAPTFSPDGRSILAMSPMGLKVWSTTRGESISIPGWLPGERVESLGDEDNAGLSTDRRVVVFTTQDGPQVMDVVTGDRRSLLGDRVALSTAVSSNGSRIAILGGDHLIRIWESDRELGWIMRAHELEVIGVAFSPDGHTVATSSADGTVRLSNLDSRQSQVLRGHESIHSVAFSQDGTRLVATDYGSIVRVWELATGTARVLSHDEPVTASQFSTDGQTLYTATENGRIRIWKLTAPDAPPRVLEQLGGYAIGLSPDGRLLVAAGGDGRIVLWDLVTGRQRQIGHHERFDAIGDVKFLPDGKRVVTRGGRDSKHDHSVHLWDLETGSGRIVFSGSSPLRTLAVSVNGEIAVGGHDNIVHIIRPVDGAIRALRGHTEAIRTLRFSPDGALVASAGEDKTVRLWVVATGASQIVTRHDGFIRNVEFSPDGKRLASTSNDHTLWVGIVRRERCLETDPIALSKRIGTLTSVVIDPDDLRSRAVTRELAD